MRLLMPSAFSMLHCMCRPTRKFHDEEVCKYSLCGFCPYEEFDKTRTDYGPCPAVHDDRCKTQWEALTDEQRAKYPYERELKKWLDKMVDDLGKKVKRNQERLDSEANPSFLPDDQVTSHTALLSACTRLQTEVFLLILHKLPTLRLILSTIHYHFKLADDWLILPAWMPLSEQIVIALPLQLSLCATCPFLCRRSTVAGCNHMHAPFAPHVQLHT